MKLTQEQTARLKELLAKKKAKSLTSSESKELDELNVKCGFKKKGSKAAEGKKSFQPGNDFSWWSKEPELLRDSANYQSNYVAGDPIAGNDIPFVVPGVLEVKLDPAYGSNRFATDPMNIWARDLYLRMFQKYRGITAYTASDLCIAIIAAAEVVKTIATYERIYGVINRYSKRNVNMPFAEQEACGISFAQADYLRNHLSDFRFDLNILIKKAQRLCIPKDMSIIADSISLFGYEYLDHESARSQIIIFSQSKYGVFSDTALTTGGSIQFDDLTSADLFDFNADNMCKALSLQMDALLGSDGIHKIFGDLVTWFGEEAMLQFLPMPEEYVVLPVKSDSILHKLHNAEPTSIHNVADMDLVAVADVQLPTADLNTVTNGQYWIYQVNDRVITTGALISQGGTHTPANFGNFVCLVSNYTVPKAYAKAHVLDAYREEMTPEVVVEGALFKFNGTLVTDTAGSAVVIDSVGFHVVRKFVLYSMSNGTPIAAAVSTTCNTSADALTVAGRMAIIDWAPLSYSFNNTNDTITEIYGDIDTVVPMYKTGLSKLLRTVVLSGIKTDVKVINK